jgi:hypothetical protein
LPVGKFENSQQDKIFKTLFSENPQENLSLGTGVARLDPSSVTTASQHHHHDHLN